MNGKQRHTQYTDCKIEKTIKELDGYRSQCAEIRRLKERRDYLQDLCTSGVRATDYSKLRVKGGLQELPIVKMTIEWADLDVEIAQKIVEHERAKTAVEWKIRNLPSDEQNVLIFYFFNGHNIDQISLIMGASPETVKRWKKKGLQHYAALGEV